MTRARRLVTRVQRNRWSRKFTRNCSTTGSGLDVQGPTIVYGGGDITVGDRFCIRSRKWKPVEVFVAPGAALSIGDEVFFNQGVRIACSMSISIGNNCLIGDECVLLDDDFHAHGGSERKVAPICLQDHVWLGTRVIVLRGVTIGEGSVVGAGSVVTRSLPPYSFAVGSPARVIDSRAGS